MKTVKRDMSLLSRYRGQLFGISIISIIIFHYFEDCLRDGYTGVFGFIAKGYVALVGSIGVEFFLLLSGMGLYYSLAKNSDTVSFYKKRLLRVALPYAIYGLIFWAVKDLIISKTDFADFILDYTLLSFWIKGNRNIWYISFILIMYIVTPALYNIFYKKSGNNVLKAFIVIFSLAAVLTFMNVYIGDIYSNIEIALTRIPVFVIGFVMGKAISEHRKFHAIFYAGFLLKILILALEIYEPFSKKYITELDRFTNCFYSIALLYVIAVIYSYIKIVPLDKFLLKCGEYSLELYLTHVTVRTIFNNLDISTSYIMYYLLVILISVILSIILHWTVEKIVGSKKPKISKESV